MQCQPGELQSRRRKKRSARQFSRSPVTGSRRSQHLLRNVLTLFTVGRSERNNDIDKKGETFKKSLLVRHDESSESRTNHRVNTRETGALFQKVNRRKNIFFSRGPRASFSHARPSRTRRINWTARSAPAAAPFPPATQSRPASHAAAFYWPLSRARSYFYSLFSRPVKSERTRLADSCRSSRSL